jgi:hypothetical protein
MAKNIRNSIYTMKELKQKIIMLADKYSSTLNKKITAKKYTKLYLYYERIKTKNNYVSR